MLCRLIILFLFGLPHVLMGGYQVLQSLLHVLDVKGLVEVLDARTVVKRVLYSYNIIKDVLIESLVVFIGDL